MQDDYKKAQFVHTSPGCGLKCPYCRGSKNWHSGQARATLKQRDRALAQEALVEHHFDDARQCGVCGELDSPDCALNC